ncbi:MULTISPECIES: lipopolysaccharide transport periplasmic protein LptA [Pseudoalteromonas]|uniref:lipopolysaccharide transport periplasmic protein LptA n=1 Tax=Pseudoalteromonas TaxID=53246 RepID=UPI00029AE4B4|nr:MULTISPECIES: lipopolysaccharide transport periplasmic protein LptA [Pseudoalteromonas]AUJ68697.1 Lipopolysaccharide export system protein LptA precursor [Pseudoalteromonas sp. NC201]MBR8845449.1 lipopolysaccharide transport periplasmic protein LptA [Pseudoalteromonas sp. JC3]MCF2825646.1 lipopolysaccharide transport periplasmic protein LptA [Pseudoalteromonas sp. OF5H-5]MCF2831787.1 lipopolysaccharide transport periplasmic protein LptA [Pseudoalteromonas sp. DL2-H6]MCF2923794.1 lipopolysac
MTSKIINKLVFIGLLASSTLAIAAEQNEVIIDAGRQQAQLQSNIGIFEQNVVIIHGNRKINADRLEVHRRAELGINKQLLVATGSPATFSERQPDGNLLEAKANEIRYDVAKGTLVISGDAEINQTGQKINAQVITYDIEKQLISAERSDQEDSRVRTILVPVDDKKDAKEKKAQEEGNN